MDKFEFTAIFSFLKFAIGLIGIIGTLVLLVWGFVVKDNKKLKKAGLIFLGAWLILITLGVIEFLFLL